MTLGYCNSIKWVRFFMIIHLFKTFKMAKENNEHNSYFNDKVILKVENKKMNFFGRNPIKKCLYTNPLVFSKRTE